MAPLRTLRHPAQTSLIHHLCLLAHVSSKREWRLCYGLTLSCAAALRCCFWIGSCPLATRGRYSPWPTSINNRRKSPDWRLKLTKHYQDGYIRFAIKKSVPHRWESLWWENSETGKRVRRTVVIRTVEKYPTEELANAAINGMRLQLNSERNRLMASNPLLTVGGLTQLELYISTS